jgi:hypothetical protein
MWFRVIGIFAAVIGVAAIGMGIWSLIAVNEMASQLVSIDDRVDTDLWKHRLQLTSSVVLVVGLATFAGGLALFRGRRSGLLLMAMAAAGLGAFPWALAAGGHAVFPFELPSIPETVILGAVAVFAFIAYLVEGRGDGGA